MIKEVLTASVAAMLLLTGCGNSDDNSKAYENTYWSSDDREGMRYNQLIKDTKEVPGPDLEKCEHI